MKPTTRQKAMDTAFGVENEIPNAISCAPEILRSLAYQVEALTAELQIKNAECDLFQHCCDLRDAALDKLKKQESVGWFKYDKVSQCYHPQFDDLAERYSHDQKWVKLYLAAGAQPSDELAALQADADRLKQALKKINVIRDDIISTQSINWSRHIYPLVAALDEVGVNCEIDAARAAS